MDLRIASGVASAFLFLCATAHGVPAERAGIESLNRALADVTRRFDVDATVALWEEDGISLLPLTRPLVGRAAIAHYLADTAARMPGAHVDVFELQCHDIRIEGGWASEWCEEHQVVTVPGRKVPFDSHGVLLLVLHRGADRSWRLAREMWNEAARAEPAPAP